MVHRVRILGSIGLVPLMVMAAVPAQGTGIGLDLDVSESASQRARLGAELIVGFNGPVSSLAVTQAGGTVRAVNDRLQIALVSAPSPAATGLSLAGNPAVAFVEKNGPVFALQTESDASGWDASGWDASGWDASGWDASGWDASGWDASGWDASGWDASGWDASGWDASGWDASGWDASGWDASGWDASGWDASGWDASGWDASGWDASGWDASGWDASGWDSATLTAQGHATTSYGATADPLFPKQWGIRAVHGPQARSLSAGAAATICVVDSGVDATHPDLASRMWRDAQGRTGYDFVNRDNDPSDDAGHGTHVAGIAAAASRNGAGIMGASDAKIMSVKVLDAKGVGTEGNLAMGIDWCATRGAKVISLSLGTPEHSNAVKRAVEKAVRDGVTIVASIGNAGKCYDCVRFPAAYPEVIAVGAIRPDGTPAPFSSVSWEVDLAAPGVAIVSTMPGDRYAAYNGTSQAVPHVSAAAAMIAAAKPGITPSQVYANLTATARDLGPAGKDPYVGYGALDMEAALARVKSG